MSHDIINGDNYSMANGYCTETMINETYGEFCEFIAAGFVIFISFGSPSIWFLIHEFESTKCPVYLLNKLPDNVS